MFAVIKTGGKQYKIQKDIALKIEKLDIAEGETFQFHEILAVNDGQSTIVGAPHVSGFTVEAELVQHIRGPKVIIFRKKKRKNYRRKLGHKQHLSLVKIKSIERN